jgi:tetratricopeptide (TPR) repeat protein
MLRMKPRAFGGLIPGLCFACSLATSATVVAQDLPPDCPKKPVDDESARALAGTWFSKGERLVTEKQFSEAVAAFRCSLRHVAHPATYYNAAKAALLAEEKQVALEMYRDNLKLDPYGDSSAEVQQEIKRLEAEIADEHEQPPAETADDEDGPQVGPEPEPEP